MPKQSMASPARSSTDGGCAAGLIPRSTSVKAPSTSPLFSTASHQPARASVSTPTTPAYSRQHKLPSINCGMAVATPTDTPPATPKDKQQQPKTASSYYASMWSPRKLMERASRAFRGAGRSRRKKKRDHHAGDNDSPRSVASMGSSDAASVVSLDEQIADDVVHGGGAKQDQDHHHLEVVPEKIIHEANLPAVNHQPTVAEEQEERPKTPEKETVAAAAAEEEEEPNKVAAAPADPVDGAVTDKFEVVKQEAAAEKLEVEEAETKIKAEVVRRFQGSRVKTSMEKRSDEEQPRRRETASSNDVIEEARAKLLGMRQGSRVKALVGAFETVMDTPRSARAAAAGKPQFLHVRTSTA